VIHGPAIVESPASTMPIPPGRWARLDENRIFHLSVQARAASPPAA
jgi:N-methylhydantoinase A/oxoprolinase/acetone carboxylase beta subunit